MDMGTQLETTWMRGAVYTSLVCLLYSGFSLFFAERLLLYRVRVVH